MQVQSDDLYVFFWEHKEILRQVKIVYWHFKDKNVYVAAESKEKEILQAKICR